MNFTRIRFLLLIVVMGTAGVVLLVRWIGGIPAFEDLSAHSGPVATVRKVERKTRYATHEDLEVRLVGRLVPMRYLDWFPRFDQVATSISPGLELTVRYDENDWLWHAEANGVVLVDYEEVTDAVKYNESWNPIFSAVLFAAFAWGVWRHWTTRVIRPRSASIDRPFELDDDDAWNVALRDPRLVDLFRIALLETLEDLLEAAPMQDAVYIDTDRYVVVRGEFLSVGGMPADAVVVSGATREARHGWIVVPSYFVHPDGAEEGFDILSGPRLIGRCENLLREP
jgi:hypothetical protein